MVGQLAAAPALAQGRRARRWPPGSGSTQVSTATTAATSATTTARGDRDQVTVVVSASTDSTDPGEADQRGGQQAQQQPAPGQRERREPPRVEGLVDAGEQHRHDQPAEGHGAAEDHDQRAGQVDVDEPQGDQAPDARRP